LVTRELGDEHAQASTLGRLGDTYHVAGQPHQARSTWQQALNILTDLHHPDAYDMLDKISSHDGDTTTPDVS